MTGGFTESQLIVNSGGVYVGQQGAAVINAAHKVASQGYVDNAVAGYVPVSVTSGNTTSTIANGGTLMTGVVSNVATDHTTEIVQTPAQITIHSESGATPLQSELVITDAGVYVGQQGAAT